MLMRPIKISPASVASGHSMARSAVRISSSRTIGFICPWWQRSLSAASRQCCRSSCVRTSRYIHAYITSGEYAAAMRRIAPTRAVNCI